MCHITAMSCSVLVTLQKDWSNFMKEHMANKQTERFTSSFTGETQTKTTMLYDFIPIRMVENKSG